MSRLVADDPLAVAGDDEAGQGLRHRSVEKDSVGEDEACASARTIHAARVSNGEEGGRALDCEARALVCRSTLCV